MITIILKVDEIRIKQTDRKFFMISKVTRESK
jgi:hypothetical protein